MWSGDSSGFAQGSVNGTSYLTTNGDLTLATNSTYGEMTDFETSKLQFASWSSQGDEFWMPVNLSNVTYGPQNATSGDYAAGTNGSILLVPRDILGRNFGKFLMLLDTSI